MTTFKKTLLVLGSISAAMMVVPVAIKIISKLIVLFAAGSILKGIMLAGMIMFIPVAITAITAMCIEEEREKKRIIERSKMW